MRKKYTPFLAGFVFIFYGLLRLSAAQAGDDMDIFLMYYEEKDLVISSTRHLKPMSQIPENITVIRKEAIENMNAHTLAEVLDRVTGLFVYFHTRNFGSPAQPEIQGSYARHVLVMVDGFSWGTLYTRYTQTLTIPVQIIERIEIIKGPASSAWGASLGGVINIITKPTGISGMPKGTFKGSYGKENRQDYRADLSGRLGGKVGYYMYGGRHYADPSLTDDPYTNCNLYSKISLPVSEMIDVDLSAGYSNPEVGVGDPIEVLYDIFYKNTTANPLSTTAESVYMSNLGLDTRFITSNLNFPFRQNVNASIAFNYFDQASNIPIYEQTTTDLVMDFASEEKVTRINGKIVFMPAKHTIVAGLDYEHGTLDQRFDSQLTEFESKTTNDMSMEKWAIYANDTFVLNRFSITPGIRYDHSTIDGSFVSPSFGVAYTLSQAATLKASIARGFTPVPLAFHANSNWLIPDTTASIEPETIWAYQAGLEYGFSKYIRFKTNLFYYDMDKTIRVDENGFLINAGETRSYGTELEMSTCPVYDLSLSLGTAYTYRDVPYRKGTTERYTYNVGIRYDDRMFNMELYGHYVEWGKFVAQSSEEDDFIWDLNLNKMFSAPYARNGKFFIKVHNLFNGSQYTVSRTGNPKRWIEAGVGIYF